MQVSVGYGDNPDSVVAGRQAAQRALENAGKTEPCDLALLFCTARHNQQILRETVVSAVKNAENIWGGGAAGVITNDYFGYAGDQVGLACIWLEDSSCTMLAESGLAESEVATGQRLGKQLLNAGITQDRALMLFYDAFCQNEEGMRLIMATALLQGIEKGLGFLPEIMGAGLQGDHASTPTLQYTGNEMEKHSAISLAFSDDICVDNIIMHGCRPASAYYTVTKADGPVILEIEGQPAIKFMDNLLESAIAPEEYPFFLTFGLNNGDPWGEYDESSYASRLCLGIDKERDGIIMFEPDMVAGMSFQIMFRSLDLGYMTPKIEKIFAGLDGREPIFALYIDCAGRCAGYGGIDIEDALVIQRAVGDKIPLLGIYTGAEIAPMGGRSRGLDLTGVFCLFSKRKVGQRPKKKPQDQNLWNESVDKCKKEKPPLDAVLRLCERNAAKVLALDNESIAIRHELEQKRRGFSLLAELSVSLRESTTGKNQLMPVTQRINSALNMQKTIVLFPETKSQFVPYVLQGYSVKEKEALMGLKISIDKALLTSEQPTLVTGADSPERFKALRETLGLPYFVAAPIIVKKEVAAILITGRMVESPPFLCRMGRSDVETLQAIGALLASVLVYRELDDANRQAQSDALTGLLNRGALEQQVEQWLKNGLKIKKQFAFIIIDCDYFKEINDSYGHLEGDTVLNALARFLCKNFRVSDKVARIGGDEFVVFCEFKNSQEEILSRVSHLVETWSKNELVTKAGVPYNSTISIGISFAPQDGDTYDKLFQSADIALYNAKHLGRDQYAIYNAKTMGNILP